MLLTRRDWLAGAAVGLAGGTVGGTAEAVVGSAVARAPRTTGANETPTPATIDAFLAPLAPGGLLGPWQVERLVELHSGAASVVLKDAAGVAFQLDICARDDAKGALVPPGRSERFDVYLANGGTGEKASFEHHGLAAMAIADVLRQNEAVLANPGYRTLRERLATAYDSVQRRA
jgi:hypothetical protein